MELTLTIELSEEARNDLRSCATDEELVARFLHGVTSGLLPRLREALEEPRPYKPFPEAP